MFSCKNRLRYIRERALLETIFEQLVFHLRPSPDHAFSEFSFGPDIITIFTDAPGLPRGEVWQDRPIHGAGLELEGQREKSTLALTSNFCSAK